MNNYEIECDYPGDLTQVPEKHIYYMLFADTTTGIELIWNHRFKRWSSGPNFQGDIEFDSFNEVESVAKEATLEIENLFTGLNHKVINIKIIVNVDPDTEIQTI